MDNIELRSEKVRNIIGKMPPFLIRSGISIIVFVFISIIAGSYFFTYPVTISSEVYLNPKTKTATFQILDKEMDKIKIGQTIQLTFPQIEEPEFLLTATIENINDSLFIENGGAYKKILASYSIDSKLSIQPNTKALAKINVGEKRAINNVISFFQRKK